MKTKHSIFSSCVFIYFLVFLLFSFRCSDDNKNASSPSPCENAQCDPIANCDDQSGTAICTCPDGYQDTNGDGTKCDLVCANEGESFPISIPEHPRCCEGLTEINCFTVNEFDECVSCGTDIYCTSCGNGECEDPENKCNCNIDCI